MTIKKHIQICFWLGSLFLSKYHDQVFFLPKVSVSYQAMWGVYPRRKGLLQQLSATEAGRGARWKAALCSPEAQWERHAANSFSRRGHIPKFLSDHGANPTAWTAQENQNISPRKYNHMSLLNITHSLHWSVKSACTVPPGLLVPVFGDLDQLCTSLPDLAAATQWDPYCELPKCQLLLQLCI